jgi:plastocyanin
MRSLVRAIILGAPVLLSACGGGGGGDDGGNGPAQVATSVSISPATVDTLFSQGATVDLNAAVLDQQGTAMNNAAVTWSTSNAGLATVNTASGLVTAGAVGNTPQSVNVTVSVNGVSGVTATRAVPVRQKLASLDLPATANVNVGSTVALTASPRDANGNAIPGLTGAVYGSANSGIATVNGVGVVSGVAPGTVKIGATLTRDGAARTDSTTVTVAAVSGNATVNTVGSTFNPSTVTIARTGTVTFNIGATHDLTWNPGNPSVIAGISLCSTGICTGDRTFGTAGTHGFHCSIHGGPGIGMSGSVVVNP